MATMTKTQDAQPMGEYKETDIDRRKREVDFRIIDIDRKSAFIVWKDGRRESVTRRQLAKLEKEFTWHTDF